MMSLFLYFSFILYCCSSSAMQSRSAINYFVWVNGARKIPFLSCLPSWVMRLFATLIFHGNVTFFASCASFVSPSIFLSVSHFAILESCHCAAIVSSSFISRYYCKDFFPLSSSAAVNRFCHSIDLPFTTCTLQNGGKTSCKGDSQQYIVSGYQRALRKSR